jgi:hypothetical protein
MLTPHVIALSFRFALRCLATHPSVSTPEATGNRVTPALQGERLGKNTVENLGDLVGSAWLPAWPEATEPANKSSLKR